MNFTFGSYSTIDRHKVKEIFRSRTHIWTWSRIVKSNYLTSISHILSFVNFFHSHAVWISCFHRPTPSWEHWKTCGLIMFSGSIKKHKQWNVPFQTQCFLSNVFPIYFSGNLKSKWVQDTLKNRCLANVGELLLLRHEYPPYPHSPPPKNKKKIISPVNWVV